MDSFQNLWESIGEQVRAYIDDTVSHYGIDYPLDALNGKYHWYLCDPFVKPKFEHEHAELTLLGWMNATEALFGGRSGERCADYLSKCIGEYLETLNHEYPDQQQILQVECEESIELGESA